MKNGAGLSQGWLRLGVVPLLCAGLAVCGTNTTRGRGLALSGGSTSGAGAGAGGADLFDAGTSLGPPPVDAGGICGNVIHQLTFDAPNIYFVLDTSGSMGELVGGNTKYELVHAATVDMIRKLGPRINVGAALFPLGASQKDGCHAGDQVFPMTAGDPVPKQLGPTAKAFANATDVQPNGGTPTAATLVALRPTITALAGRTIVVLATDGGPNCDTTANCTIDDCTGNVENVCQPGVNCCVPGGALGPTGCVDRKASVDAIAALQAAGVPVYVLGIPGSQFYGGVLDDMALAGGVPQIAPPFYYQITDLANLGAVLGGIAAGVVSCDFNLVKPPPLPDNTNVYLDQTLLPSDPVDGWVWKTPKIVELRGKACQQLKTGEVSQVQIVSGCPTKGGT